MKIYIALGIFLMVFSSVSSQAQIKDFKYVIIPINYDFTQGQDKFRLNTLTRYLFKEKGFEVYFDIQELPKDLAINRCLALYGDVKKVKGGLLRTNVKIILQDCFGKNILQSEEGTSRLKEYKAAYSEAIKNAFESFGSFNQPYESAENYTSVSQSNSLILSEAKGHQPQEKPSTEEVNNNRKSNQKELILLEESPVYYVRLTSEGFQLMNDNSEVIMTLLKTSDEDIFIVKGQPGVVFRKDRKWIYAENSAGSVQEKELRIKF